jgi:hypothetical protein
VMPWWVGYLTLYHCMLEGMWKELHVRCRQELTASERDAKGLGVHGLAESWLPQPPAEGHPPLCQHDRQVSTLANRSFHTICPGWWVGI